MTDERKLIGNEASAGSRALSPAMKRVNQRVISDFHVARERRQQLIDVVAAPPPIPLAAKIIPAAADNPNFNQIAYSVLLIAILAAVAAGTSLINWAFLVYGLLAVLARLPSSQMFVAALISLLLIPVSTVFQRNSLANTFSVMAFYFLLIGLIRAALELRRSAKLASKKAVVKQRKT